MKIVLRVVTVVSGLCFALGLLAAMSNLTREEVIRLGNTLIIAGAILTAGVLISWAILVKGKQE